MIARVWNALGRACTFPFRAMGWQELDFTNRLKLLAFAIQTGGGIAMTAFAAYAMYHLAQRGSVNGLLTMGMTALLLVGIVLTGFGALLYKRDLKMEVFGNKLEVTDSQAAPAAAEAMKTLTEGDQK